MKGSDGAIIRPKRISFTQKILDEGWIQELIRANPEILPVDEVESVFSPPISVGREVPTKVGFIDNLYLSPQGYLTIVETKLWRNPEARREVVGQIIDYAKEISKWSFKELEEQVGSYNQKYRNTNLGVVKTLEQDQAEDFDEPTLIETISRNIRQGRFLLLIVGDGIRESVEDMVEFLAQTPQLQFTLALIELQIYELDQNQNKSFLIIPQIVTRTREITRAIVKIEAKEIKDIQVDIDEDNILPPKEKFFVTLGKSVKPELVNFARSIIDDLEGLGCIVEWHSASYVIKLPDPGGSRINFSLISVYNWGAIFVGSLADQLNRAGLPKQIGLDYTKNTASLFNYEVSEKDPGFWSWKNRVELSQLQEKYDEFRAELQQTINKIRKASNEEI